MNLKYRLRKVSEILKTLDAADVMVRLGDQASDKAAGSGRFVDTVPCMRSSGSKYDVLSITGIDGDAGVKLLSTDALMRVFRSDRRCRCKMVYKRRQSDRRCANLARAQMMTSAMDGEENGNDWIVDPHPLEWYGETLHTPAEVIAMFSDM
ncbi:hypothetical protein Hanom_Chr01g00051341 [Helianthus anomalus]